MRCPKCTSTNTKVVDSRDTNDSKEIRRRRECEDCSFRFTTFEQYPLADFMVKKNDGTKEKYQRDKVTRGIWHALRKRNIDGEIIDSAITELENEWSSLGKLVSSDTIGEGILRKLKEIDQVAYIRFASIYRDFQDLESFQAELNNIKD